MVTPALGTPSSGVATNLTGTASGLTAGNVTTNANLTGPITSSGNATSVAAQTGTGSTFAMQASPTFTGTVGVAAITATGNVGLGDTTTGNALNGWLLDTNGKFTSGRAATFPSLSLNRTDATGVAANQIGQITVNATNGASTAEQFGLLRFFQPVVTAGSETGELQVNLRNGASIAAIQLDLTPSTFTVAPATTFSNALTYGGVTLANSVTGTGSMALATSPAFTTPSLGAATATTINGDALTAGSFTLTGAAAKTLTFNNSLTLAGTDGQTETFPSTSASIARTDAAQTFTGVQTFNTPIAVGSGGSGVANTGNLTWNAAQTFSFTSGQTMTFPATTATIARTDAAQTFTGSQTLSSALIYGGVTLSNSVTGTGSMALSASPAFTGTVTAVALTTTGAVSVGNASNLLWTGRGILTSPAAATIQVGAADGASPPAELFEFQSVVAGTSNTAGVNSTIQASRGTGTGAGGDIIFKAAPAGTTGTAQNAVVTAFTISNKGIPVLPSFTVATLPASPPAGSLAMVTDQLTACPANLVAPTGGGAVICPVVYTTAWLGL